MIVLDIRKPNLCSAFVSVTLAALTLMMAAQATQAATPSQRVQCHNVCVQSKSQGPLKPAECLRWAKVCN
jgi:hypothetical protein